ncbi:MAG: DUF3667 domain-containing protein [Gemmatimonadota bacterium]|nr:DUF3667 domain-containing protein [Gemmatimonadota bacterium]
MESPDERLTGDGSASGDPGERCLNCGRLLDGRYCATCGQSDTDFDIPVARFAKEFLSESFDLDARLRQTVGPLFLRPGHVAAEYVAGHRARFVPPIRMYVLASFVMFLVLSLTAGPASVVISSGEPGSDTTAVQEDSSAVTSLAPAEAQPVETEEADGDATFSQRMSRGALRASEDPEAFRASFLNRMAQLMFVLLPAFALLLKAFWPRRLYVHHLIFSVNFHTVVFFTIAVAKIVSAIPAPGTDQIGAVIMLGVPVHLFGGIRRFYGQRWVPSVLKGIGVGLLYLALLTTSLLVVVVLAVLWQ